MHAHHDVFVTSIHRRTRIALTFFSKEDRRELKRSCAPMDFGPSRRAKLKVDRYHFWDYDSDTERHTLSLVPAQVVRIEATEIVFDPAEFVTWSIATSPWFIERDWGDFS
jgi:hypothetical protein